MNKKKFLIIVGFVISALVICFSIYKIVEKKNIVDKDSKGEVLNKHTKIKADFIDIKNDINEVEFKYYNKNYDEIIEMLNTEEFDKNIFNGKFVIFQVSDNHYYSTTPMANLKKVLATWDDISNYNSYLYKNLDLNKEIEYSFASIYVIENNIDPIYRLEVANKDSFSKSTIKEAFDNNNIALCWYSTANAKIISNYIIEVPNNIVNKYDKNELGIFIELLGNPSRIYEREETKTDIKYIPVVRNFDLVKNYVLYWEYDNYFIRMEISVTYLENEIVSENIGNVCVKNKNSNSSLMSNYQTALYMDEKQKTN